MVFVPKTEPIQPVNTTNFVRIERLVWLILNFVSNFTTQITSNFIENSTDLQNIKLCNMIKLVPSKPQVG